MKRLPHAVDRSHESLADRAAVRRRWPARAAEEPAGRAWMTQSTGICQVGRAPAREPYINTDQGDLLLFLFLLAGAVGGFIAGYTYPQICSRQKRQLAKQTMHHILELLSIGRNPGRSRWPAATSA